MDEESATIYLNLVVFAKIFEVADSDATCLVTPHVGVPRVNTNPTRIFGFLVLV